MVRALSEREARELRPVCRCCRPACAGAAGGGGAGVAALIGGVTASGVIFWSALYGMVAVVVPSLLCAWHDKARGFNRHSGCRIHGLGILKIGASIAMLVLAPKVVPALSWPALLVTPAVCIKVNWLALLWRGH